MSSANQHQAYQPIPNMESALVNPITGIPAIAWYRWFISVQRLLAGVIPGGGAPIQGIGPGVLGISTEGEGISATAEGNTTALKVEWNAGQVNSLGANLARDALLDELNAVPSGTDGQVQANVAGVFEGLTNTELTALVDQFTLALSGAVPPPGLGAPVSDLLHSDGSWGPASALALATDLPANPTGTTSTTGVMMGLAGSITPTLTGKVLVLVEMDVRASVIGDGAKVQLRWGIGAVPTNGAVLTGTPVGRTGNYVASTVAGVGNIGLSWIISGLAPSVPTWLDVSLAAVTGGTATISNLSIVATELY